MNTLANILRQHIELAVFLTLALGFLLGRLKIGSFKLGAMLGTLFAGMIVGQIGIHIAPVVKIIFFDLFLFATGYKVGPQFFNGLRKNALPQLMLTFVICTTCLLTAFTASKILGYDIGTACGLLAGAFSESTVIGTASDAIQKLALASEKKEQLINNIAVVYAVTYLIGTVANVWFLSSLAPKLMRVNLHDEATKLAKQLEENVDDGANVNSAYKEWTLRAFIISGNKWNGQTVAEIEMSIPDVHIFVERIRKNGRILEPHPKVLISKGDTLVIAARQSVMLEQLADIGEEVFDKQLLDFPLVNKDIIISKKGIAGKTLRELSRQNGYGVMLDKLTRAGEEVPIEPRTTINNGDVLSISGRKHQVETAIKTLGYAEIKRSETDIVFIGLGIFLGGLVGLLSLKLGGIEITLSTSGGALVMGLLFGWIHSKTPKAGHIPEAALWVFDNLGLATFLGIIGIAAGRSFISGLSNTGFSIVAAGVIVALLPHVIGLLFGRFVLKINPVILLGAQAGAGTTTTGLKALQDAADSKLPVLGYTIPYALGNILLTAWGPIMVSLMTL